MQRTEGLGRWCKVQGCFDLICCTIMLWYDMISYEMIWCLKGRMPVFSRQHTWQTNACTSPSWDQIPGPKANNINLIKCVISNQYHLPEVSNSTIWVPQDSCSRPKALVSATKIDFIQAIEANESSARRRDADQLPAALAVKVLRFNDVMHHYIRLF